MKTISVRATSSKPISLSKATSVLTTFVAAEAGVSQAMAAYLRRTVEAFKELNQLHKELKGSKSGRKHKRAKADLESHGLPETTNEHDIEKSVKESHKRKKKKKKKKKKMREEMSSLEFEEERNEEKKKKKRKNPEVEEGGVEHLEEQRSKKKRKKRD